MYDIDDIMTMRMTKTYEPLWCTIELEYCMVRAGINSNSMNFSNMDLNQ